MFPKTGFEALLTPEDCVVILIDHQPFQFTNVHSHDPLLIINNSTGLAEAAKIYGVPCILTTVAAARGGNLIPQIQAVYPDVKPLDRTTMNAWEEKTVVEAFKQTRRKRLVMAALWTEICLAQPVIQALGEGWDVTIVTDASAGVSVEAHERAIQRMIAAGANPMTFMAVYAEWQRDWARTEHIKEALAVSLEHRGNWACVPLGSPAPRRTRSRLNIGHLS
jgi:nicotinamidase-related amidase